MDYTVRVKTYDTTDPRLGRHVRHDSRSLDYQIQAQDISTLKSIKHIRYIPVLDQGQVGSCTGNAATGCLGSSVYWTEGQQVLTQDAVNDENFAVGVYSDAENIDGDGPYPPNDNGSSGLSVAKVLQSRGLISGYQHATSLEAALTALALTPVIIGIPWHQDMFQPDGQGQIRPTGNIAGGHEIVLDELDVENKRVWLCNSWGEGWGIKGRAFLSWDDFGALLANDGDCTVFVPAGVVVNPTPTPSPAPSPAPSQVEVKAKDLMKKIRRAVSEFVDDVLNDLN